MDAERARRIATGRQLYEDFWAISDWIDFSVDPGREPTVPDRPAGRVLIDPEHWTPVYTVRRWFTFRGHRVERGELVRPGRLFWAEFTAVGALVGTNYLEPLTERVLAFWCPCQRLWATDEAFLAHGCAELPPEITSTPRAEPDSLEALGLPERECSLIRRWQAGDMPAAMGDKWGISAKTVNNIICDLRRQYGWRIVPWRAARMSKSDSAEVNQHE